MSWRTIFKQNEYGATTSYILTGSLSVFGEFSATGYLLVMGGALVVVSFLAVTVPYYMFKQMQMEKDKGTLHTSAVKNKLGWLYHSYTKQCYWYELVLIEGRFLLLLIGTIMSEHVILSVSLHLGPQQSRHRLQ